jgi:hypothetical protein
MTVKMIALRIKLCGCYVGAIIIPHWGTTTKCKFPIVTTLPEQDLQ